MRNGDVYIVCSENSIMTNIIDESIEAFQPWMNYDENKICLVPSVKSDKKACFHLPNDITEGVRFVESTYFMAGIYAGMPWVKEKIYVVKGEPIIHDEMECYRFALDDAESIEIPKSCITLYKTRKWMREILLNQSAKAHTNE